MIKTSTSNPGSMARQPGQMAAETWDSDQLTAHNKAPPHGSTLDQMLKTRARPHPHLQTIPDLFQNIDFPNLQHRDKPLCLDNAFTTNTKPLYIFFFKYAKTPVPTMYRRSNCRQLFKCRGCLVCIFPKANGLCTRCCRDTARIARSVNECYRRAIQRRATHIVRIQEKEKDFIVVPSVIDKSMRADLLSLRKRVNKTIPCDSLLFSRLWSTIQKCIPDTCEQKNGEVLRKIALSNSFQLIRCNEDANEPQNFSNEATRNNYACFTLVICLDGPVCHFAQGKNTASLAPGDILLCKVQEEEGEGEESLLIGRNNVCNIFKANILYTSTPLTRPCPLQLGKYLDSPYR